MTLQRFYMSAIAGIVLVLVCQASGTDENRIPLWSAGISAHPAKGYGIEDRFSLRFVTQEGLHITGRCTYYQLEHQAPVKIEGTKTEDGSFWPDVISQVKNKSNGKWETISTPFNHGHRGVVTVGPGQFNQDLLVSLDVFLPFVTRCELGRLVLKNGDVAVFELNDLLEH